MRNSSRLSGITYAFLISVTKYFEMFISLVVGLFIITNLQ